MSSLRSRVRKHYPFLARLWGQLRWHTSRRGLRQTITAARLKVGHWGTQVECPFCGWRGRAFYPHPAPHPRPNAVCPRCHSKERHRLLYLYLTSHDVLAGNSIRVLEIGPERNWPLFFGQLPHVKYIGLDIQSTHATVLGDVASLPLASCCFDVVICYHVFEHVPKDRQAMREIHRVLSPHGMLFAAVPISGDSTVEDPTVTDPAERERRFGQVDHVRRYGTDFADRLANAGFDTQTSDFAENLSPETIHRYGLHRHEPMYLCRRGAYR